MNWHILSYTKGQYGPQLITLATLGFRRLQKQNLTQFVSNF